MQHEQHQQFLVSKFVAHFLEGDEFLVFCLRRSFGFFQPFQQVNAAIRPFIQFTGKCNQFAVRVFPFERHFPFQPFGALLLQLVECKRFLQQVRVQIHLLAVDNGLGHMDLAKPRQNRAQQLVLVLHHDEKPGGMVEQLDAAPKRRLRVGRQLVCIHQHHALEYLSVLQVHIGFGKEFQVLANESDALVVRTIHVHDVILQRHLVVAINAAHKAPGQRVLAAARHPVKYDVGYFPVLNEMPQFLLNIAVNVYRQLDGLLNNPHSSFLFLQNWFAHWREIQVICDMRMV